jgi:hypothetical protein
MAMLRAALCIVASFFIVALPYKTRAQTVRTQIPVVTRLVQAYAGYEQHLADAINRRDTAEIERLVAKDFELRPANNIGVPTPRADWIAQSLKEPPVSVSIEQMAVHDYKNIRIVSYVMKRTSADRSERDIAVIDVWMQSGDTSVLKVRYAAVQIAHSLRVPGESQQQQIKKRY